MTSFLAIEHYSPLAVLAVGLATFFGFWGLGTALLRAIRLNVPPPWNDVTAVLLGILAESLAVQIVGMFAVATHGVLVSLWWLLLAITVAAAVFRRPRIRSFVFAGWKNAAFLPAAIIGIALIVNLLVAMAPSSKIDELYYHMLVPSRIVTDGALHFYRLPWEAAIWPQMIFQIAAAPVHALGYPDAMNVVSWALAAMLAWFVWQILHVAGLQSSPWILLWAASTCVGLYPVVWHVTGGAHAMGDLAMAAAVTAIFGRRRLLADLSAPAHAALVSILLGTAASSKISLLPLCGLLLAFTAWRSSRSVSPAEFGKSAFALAAPWLIFLCPIAVWCAWQSGSPFGPVLAGSFAPSIYPADFPQQTFQAVRSSVPLEQFVERTAIGYSPLIWLGAIGAIAGTSLPMSSRAVLAGSLIVQCSLIYFLLPHDARFLGGLQYGLVIVFAIFALPRVTARLTSARAVTAASLLFLVPWLGAQIFYASQFIPVSLGLEKDAFYQREVAFYSDYVKLDGILPNNAVLLVAGFRPDAVYAPRPVFFNDADLPADRPAVLFASTIGAARFSAAGYRLGDVLYENDQAVLTTFRTPGRPPRIGQLRVIKLIKID
jgi:hypothetical protein